MPVASNPSDPGCTVDQRRHWVHLSPSEREDWVTPVLKSGRTVGQRRHWVHLIWKGDNIVALIASQRALLVNVDVNLVHHTWKGLLSNLSARSQVVVQINGVKVSKKQLKLGNWSSRRDLTPPSPLPLRMLQRHKIKNIFYVYFYKHNFLPLVCGIYI